MSNQSVRDIMVGRLVTVAPDATVLDIARRMRDEDVGTALVLDGDQLRGVVTDRDLVVRGLAGNGAPAETTAAQVCSSSTTTISADAPVSEAVETMRSRKIRRLPVLDDRGRPQGVLSIGDLATHQDPTSALASISAAPPNR